MKDAWLGLDGRVCVITGASGGIGRALATAFASQGARLLLLDRDAVAVQDLARGITAAGGQAIASACDVSEPDSVEAAASLGTELGPYSILVNNAGILRPGALADLSLRDWNDLLKVNLTGYFVCSQIFGRAMRDAHSGSLIHISSISGVFPQSYSGAYSVSKAGISMLSRGLAAEWGEFGVRSNVVSPAMVRTPLTDAMYQDSAIVAKRQAVIPLRRIGVPQDIAEATLFIASERASYISGEEILVDGGWQRNMLNMVPRPGYSRPED